MPGFCPFCQWPRTVVLDQTDLLTHSECVYCSKRWAEARVGRERKNGADIEKFGEAAPHLRHRPAEGQSGEEAKGRRFVRQSADRQG